MPDPSRTAAAGAGAPQRGPGRTGVPSPAAGVFWLLLAIYLLTASRTLQVGADEMVVFGTVESLVKWGRLDVDQLASLPKGEVWDYGVYGPDGRQYGKYGLVHALAAAPLYALALAVPGVSIVQTVLLLNPIVTALTGAALVAAARALGASPRSAALLGLVYGLGTLAWPYTRTFFGEPLSALLVAGAALFALRCRAEGGDRWALLTGAGLALAAGVKLSNLALAPGLALLALGPALPGARPARAAWRSAALLAAPIALGLGVQAWLNALRFGSPFATGYGPEPGFTTSLGPGLAGLLWSPGKSLFLYAPALALALVGLPLLAWRDRGLALALLLALAPFVLLNALWWAWWGGWGWGPRLLLPATPLLALTLLPVIERAVERGGRWLVGARALLGAALLASLVVQVPGVAVHYARYLGDRVASDPLVNGETVWSWSATPLLAQWRYLQPDRLDFPWLAAGRVDWLVLGAALGAVALAAAALAAGPSPHPPAPAPTAVGGGVLGVRVAAAVLVVGAPLLALARGPGVGPAEFGALVAELEAHQAETAAIVFSAYARQDALLDRWRGRTPVLGAPESDPLPPRLAAKLEATLGAALDRPAGAGRDRSSEPAPRVALVAQSPPGDPASGVERAIAARLFPLRTAWYGTTRLCWFTPSPVVGRATAGAVGARFGDRLALDRYEALLSDDPPWLFLTLTWHADAAVDRRYTVTAQLLDEAGRLVAQQDGEPAGGTRPTTAWPPGTPVVDRRLLDLRALGAGRYALIVALYDPQTGARLGTAAGDHVRLAAIEPLAER